MRVNKPFSTGKIILTYNGSRINLQNIQSKYFKIYAYGMKELINGLQENLLVQIKLFDENEVAISLISNNLYTSSKFENKTSWNNDERNYAMMYSIILDEEIAIFKGSFIVNLPFYDDFIEERYNFTIIFISPTEIKYNLLQNKIEFMRI